MITNKGKKWQYSTDKLYIGEKLIKEVYVGTQKVYPIGANLMRLREIVEDDARYYGDAGGVKYNWYIWCAGDYGEVYDTFGSGDRSLFVRIFCDWHAPKNGQYYIMTNTILGSYPRNQEFKIIERNDKDGKVIIKKEALHNVELVKVHYNKKFAENEGVTNNIKVYEKTLSLYPSFKQKALQNYQ